MEVSISNEQKQIDPVWNLFKENCKQHKFNIDKQILKKYDQNNKHFSIKEICKEDGQRQLIVTGFHCIYRYQNSQIQLDYYILNDNWIIISQKLNSEEQRKLNILLDNINQNQNLSFDQQIEWIINKFDQFFDELNENSILNEEDQNEFSLDNNISPPSTIIELDEEETDFPSISLYIESNQKLNRFILPVTSHRIRHDSSCSSTNSLKYTEFVPPSMVSICGRRVIQSIFLRVQRKKKMFEKLIGQFKDTPTEPTMYQLGLQFLRLYDGKFNYPQGHTFVMSFEKRTWYLTINNIKCVDCPLGEPQPRSVLILQYKNKFTTVQV